MSFFTTKYINELIKDNYISFINKYYIDILSNPNKYITIVENKISEYLGGGYVKLVNSGTTSLQFGLLALGVSKGDEVILPANTYSATVIAITNIGAIPVFCDINLDNYTIDIKDIENKVTKKTKVILPVHIYGYPCYMDDINSIANRYNLKVLEDASHAFGGELNGDKLGTIGDIGSFSCHLSKNFGTFGNGGIFFTKNKYIFDKINNYIYPDIQNKEVLKSLRTPANIGVMDSIVLLFKLKYIDKIIGSNQKLYFNFLNEYNNYIIDFPKLTVGESIRNFTCLVKNREELIKKGLGKVYYDINLSESIVFGNISKGRNLKNTKYFFENCFSFNYYYGLNNIKGK